jgi:hypothetical protein
MEEAINVLDDLQPRSMSAKDIKYPDSVNRLVVRYLFSKSKTLQIHLKIYGAFYGVYELFK